jgi:hypothetical protein
MGLSRQVVAALSLELMWSARLERGKRMDGKEYDMHGNDDDFEGLA